MTDIRRIIVTAPGALELRTEAPAEVGAGQVRARSVTIGVCGSDTHALHGRHPLIPMPYFPGHEVTGVVTEVGEGVSNVAVGTRVTVEPTLPCWACKQCRQGQENLCENLQFFGCGFEQGGMADEFVVRADRLHIIPDDLDYATASLIEPLSTPVHAGRIAGPLADKAVVIMGSGTIGLLMLAVARYDGARRVVMTDPLPAKREIALQVADDRPRRDFHQERLRRRAAHIVAPAPSAGQRREFPALGKHHQRVELRPGVLAVGRRWPRCPRGRHGAPRLPVPATTRRPQLVSDTAGLLVHRLYQHHRVQSD